MATTDTYTLSVQQIEIKLTSIKTALGLAAEELADLWRARAWVTMGYESWGAMLSAEGITTYWSDVDDRVAKVGQLTDEGMSQRAIADSLGVTQMTVSRDLSTETNVSVDEPREIMGLDGKVRTYAPKPVTDFYGEGGRQETESKQAYDESVARNSVPLTEHQARVAIAKDMVIGKYRLNWWAHAAGTGGFDTHKALFDDCLSEAISQATGGVIFDGDFSAEGEEQAVDFLRFFFAKVRETYDIPS